MLKHKISPISVRPVGSETFLGPLGMDRRTDPTKILEAFRHFANASKNKMMPKVVRPQKPRDLQLLKGLPTKRRY